MTLLQRIFLLSVVTVSAPFAFGQAFFITGSLPDGAVGQAYSASLSCNGTPAAQWSVISGNLPPGLTLTYQGCSATVSGNPTIPGTYPVAIQAADSQTNQPPALASFTIHITGPVTILTPLILPNGVVGQHYDLSLIVAGGSGAPYTWSVPPSNISPNRLPSGLSLSASGVLSGTPTNAGKFGFDIMAADSQNGSATVHFELTIAQAMTITTTSPLTTGTINTAYSGPITVSGGNPPFTFAIVDPSNAPQGIVTNSTGLGGVPKATGLFTFTVQAIDRFQYTATKQFQLAIAPAGALLQTSVKSLTFTASAGADAPPQQAILVTVPSGAPVNFGITVDGGTAGSAAPSWIAATPTGGPAPASIVVTANQGNLQPGKYSAAIHVTVPGNNSQTPIDIPVTFNITSETPQLTALPAALKFAAREAAPIAQDQFILLAKPGGGGAISFSTSVVGKSSWITALTPATGSVAANTPAKLRVFVNTQGLKTGFYRDAVRVTTATGTVDVPVSVFVSDQGPVLGLSANGLRFQVRQGAGSTQTQSVNVLDLGDVTTSSSWQAEVVSGSDWLALSQPAGVSTPLHPTAFSLTPAPGANSVGPGARYALIRITDPNAINSPQYLTAVLAVAPASSPALPDPSPAALFFASGTASQNISVYTSSTDPVAFQTTAYTNDGAPWLAATPAFGTASTSSPGKVSVSVSAGSLPPGIYYGAVHVSMNAAMRTVPVTMVLSAANCNPTKLAISQTGLVNNFSIATGLPATLTAQINDDCGNPVSNASVVAAFSNGDPPISLRGDLTSNIYSATWQPGGVAPLVTIAIRATAGTFNPAAVQYTGAVNDNSSPPPALVPNGALHIFFTSAMAATLGSALAPGSVMQVYGNRMASTASSTTVPLPDNFDGTFMLIGPRQAPLYYVSDQLLDVQIPSELTPNRQYSMVVSANGTWTLPQTIEVATVQPGVAQFADGTVIAQISGTTTLVSATNPAKPGQNLTIYLAGMGPTTPPIPSGQPTPSQLVPVNNQPAVTLDNQPVNYGYAGLTPTGIGLYQINFTVPENARPGMLDLVVSQNGVFANTTKLPVSN